MGLKTAFALLFLLGVTEYAKAAAVDDNAIVNLVMENYHEILNVSGFPIGCCPTIVPSSSVIQADTGWRGIVSLIPNYGTCTPADRDFLCAVFWGDGKKDYKFTQSLVPCHIDHQYPHKDSSYNVMAHYCGPPIPPNPAGARCCNAYFYKKIDVKNKPEKVSLKL